MTGRKTSFEAAKKALERKISASKAYSSNFKVLAVKESDTIFLINPWNDQSIALIGYQNGKTNYGIINTADGVLFPEELSGIFHLKDNTLEIVWTAYRLNKYSEEIIERKFNFRLHEKTYLCEFTKSSETLLNIAHDAAYLQVSDTGFRNLQSFTSFSRNRISKSPEKSSRLGEPISFFIRGLSEDKQEWLNVVKHLNFYLKYYDSKSPYIVIHETVSEKNNDKVRYVEGIFPKSIVSRELNPNLLSFWLAAYDHDITTRFLLYYRILEYVSGLYIQTKQRQALLKVLNSPSALASLDGTLDAVAAIVREDNMGEMDRYLKMFEELVDCGKVWKEICANPQAFTQDAKFEGGLEIKAIVPNVDNEDVFGSRGMQAVARALRQIRHALAHGGELQAGKLILPTSQNFSLLIPWVHIAMVAAGEVVIYEHLA